MQLSALDHVNVRTRNLDKMAEWYERVLDLRKGDRPSFSFPGAWLYIGDKPIVHLVGVDRALPAHQDDLRIEHFAINATGLTGFLDRLKRDNIAYKLGKVPGLSDRSGQYLGPRRQPYPHRLRCRRSERPSRRANVGLF